MIDLTSFQNFAPAAERNGGVIAQQLQLILSQESEVLEVGSGSGQHAALFTDALPDLCWQPTEIPELLPALQYNLNLCDCNRLLQPVELDLNRDSWSEGVGVGRHFDAVFTANTLHIVSWNLVESFFKGCGRLLVPGALLIVYGPIRYRGRYTSESNKQFDDLLKNRDPLSGIRDLADLESLAKSVALELVSDIAMPANNQLLVWRKAL